MFTRYSDADIPKNYGGSRFRKADIAETATKTHRGDVLSGATSTTVSPLFDSKSTVENDFESVGDERIDNGIPEVEENTQEAPDEECTFDDSLHSEQNDIAEVFDKDSAEVSEPKDTGLKSKIGDFIEKIGSDDLLIIFIIMLLASDGENKNDEAILLLSILLLLDNEEKEAL